MKFAQNEVIGPNTWHSASYHLTTKRPHRPDRARRRRRRSPTVVEFEEHCSSSIIDDDEDAAEGEYDGEESRLEEGEDEEGDIDLFANSASRESIELGHDMEFQENTRTGHARADYLGPLIFHHADTSPAITVRLPTPDALKAFGLYLLAAVCLWRWSSWLKQYGLEISTFLVNKIVFWIEFCGLELGRFVVLLIGMCIGATPSLLRWATSRVGRVPFSERFEHRLRTIRLVWSNSSRLIVSSWLLLSGLLLALALQGFSLCESAAEIEWSNEF